MTGGIRDPRSDRKRRLPAGSLFDRLERIPNHLSRGPVMTPPNLKPLVALMLTAFIMQACGLTGDKNGQSTLPVRFSNLPPPSLRAEIPMVSNCTDENDRILRLNADAPLVILVHGCTGSAGDFHTLADVFAFHGQQAVCFSYNDRDSLRVSAAQLGQAIAALADQLNHPDIILIGHSQGGLIARKALVQAHDTPPRWQTRARIRLVTIATPFAGITAARHCGSTPLAVLTMGLTIPICWMISGDKWHEITDASDFIRQPGLLAPVVHTYLKVDSNERDSCRRFDNQGRCREDDFVFSLAEQYHPDIDTDAHVDKIKLKVGHVEVVGDADRPPVKLISALQAEGIMAPTPTEDLPQLALLLRDLYCGP